MALHTELPIYRTGVRLLELAVKVQVQMPRTVATAVKRLATMDRTDLFEAANSYFGLLGQADQSHTDRALIARVLRRRGMVVNGNLRKIFRSYA